MDLRTNVVVKGADAQFVYNKIMETAKKTPSNSDNRKSRLTEFSNKIKRTK